MKFIISFVLFIHLALSPLDTAVAAPKLNPKTKAFLLMTVYGTVGGFLLGSASLAFDTPGRAPFVGASLGLYAGIAFGSYVLVSHYVEKDRQLNPQKYLEDSGAGDYGELPNQMLNQYKWSQSYHDIRSINNLNKKPVSPIYFNILNAQF